MISCDASKSNGLPSKPKYVLFTNFVLNIHKAGGIARNRFSKKREKKRMSHWSSRIKDIQTFNYCVGQAPKLLDYTLITFVTLGFFFPFEKLPWEPKKTLYCIIWYTILTVFTGWIVHPFWQANQYECVKWVEKTVFDIKGIKIWILYIFNETVQTLYII